jgi:hypothetical protein
MIRILHTILSALALSALMAGRSLAAQSVTVSDLGFSTPAIAAYNLGYSTLSSIPVLWSSDSNWIIYVQSLDPNLGTSYQGGYTKPLSDLRFKLSSDSTYIPVQYLVDQPVNTGTAGNSSFSTDWKVLLNWTADRPGDYHAQLRFTITPN